MSRPSIKVGDTFTTNNCGNCVVVEYIGWDKVKVKFITTGYECWCQTNHLKEGRVKDPYTPSVYGVGCIGEGEYKSNINGKITKGYKLWGHILERCYTKNKDYNRYGGRGITVCKEWHNFQNFASWAGKQPNFGREGFTLDKDLRIKDSKEYSPETCSFVPQNINKLTISCNKNRGKYPLGVYWNEQTSKFKSQCNNGRGKLMYLGLYPTQEEAFQAYKKYKENLIRQIAKEEYEKGNIIKEVYDNLMVYEVVPFPE